MTESDDTQWHQSISWTQEFLLKISYVHVHKMCIKIFLIILYTWRTSSILITDTLTKQTASCSTSGIEHADGNILSKPSLWSFFERMHVIFNQTLLAFSLICLISPCILSHSCPFPISNHHNHINPKQVLPFNKSTN